MTRAISIAAAAILALVAGVAGLLVAAVVTILIIYDTNDLKRLAAGVASAALGRDVAINGDADLDLGWVTRVRVNDLRIASADWAKSQAPNMAEIGQLDLAVDVWELLKGRILIPQIDILRPNIDLRRNEKGEGNWQFSAASEAAARGAAPEERTEVPIVRRLNLSAGHIAYRDAKIDRSGVLDVGRLQVTDDRDDRKVQITGDGHYQIKVTREAAGQGGPFMIRFLGDSWDRLRAADQPYPIDVDFTLGDLKLKAAGTVTDPVQLAGVQLKVDVRGDDTAKLFPITGIALPPSPPYQISGNVERRGTEWRLSGMSGKMGGSDVRGVVAIDIGKERPFLKADVISNNLLDKDLGTFIGARPSGQEGAQAAAAGKTAQRANGKVLPEKEIELGRLNAMDADVAFKANNIQIPVLPFDRLETKLTLDKGTLRVQPAVIRIGYGTVRTYLSLYGSETPVRVDIDSQIERVNLKEFLRGSTFMQETAGTLGGRAKLRATGTSVAQILGSADGQLFVVMAGGRISHLLVELAGFDIAESLGFALKGDEAVPIRCIVADMPAQQGVFDVRTLVFDTTDTVIYGSGKINMREETADVTFTPVPKDFSPLSVRSPIRIQGSFAEPSVFPDPARVGVDTTLKKILDAVLTPVIGLLPPIDEGVGKDSDCGGLIERAKRQQPQQ